MKNLKKITFIILCLILFNFHIFANLSGGGNIGIGPTLKGYSKKYVDNNNNKLQENIPYDTINLKICANYDLTSEEEKEEELCLINFSAISGKILFKDNNIYCQNLRINFDNPYGTIKINSNIVYRGSIAARPVVAVTPKPDSYVVNNNDILEIYFNDTHFYFYFKKDTVPPSISIDNPKGIFIPSNLKVDFNANDNLCGINDNSWNINYHSEDGKYQASLKKNSLTLSPKWPNGIYVFEVSVEDKIGNKNTKSFNLTLDTKGPIINYLIKPKVFDRSGKIQATINEPISGKIKYEYSFKDERKTEECDGVVIFNEEGYYKDFQFIATDLAGNTETSSTISFTIDKTPPEINVKSYTKDWTKSAVTVSATATDKNNIDPDSWKYSIDNGSIQAILTDTEFSKSFDLNTGIHNIYIYVSDKAGNEATSEKITLKVDKVKPTTPVLTLTDPNVGGITIVNGKANKYGSSVTITPKSTDENSGISTYKFSTDQNNWTTGSSYLLNKTGSYTVYCKAVDMAGNESGTTTVEVYIDNSTPSINYTTFNSDSWFSSYKILLTANGCSSGINDSTWQYSLDGGKTFNNCQKDTNGEIYLLLNKTGEYNLVFKVKSNTGIEGITASKKIKIDSTKPEIKLNSTIPSKSKSLTISVTSSDANSGISATGYEISINSQMISDVEYKNTISAKLENEGVNKLKFYAIDNAGNKVYSDEYTIVIDNTGPVVTFASVPGTWVQSAVIKAASSSTDVNSDTWKYYYQYTDGSEKSGKGNEFTLNTHGEVEVWFTVEDDCGNIGTSEKKTIRIDRKAPVFNTSFTQKGNKITATATDADSGLNLDSYKWSLDGKTYNKGNTATLKDGKKQKVYFTVEDNCGNIGSVEYTIDVVDITPPVMSFTPEAYSYKDKLTLKNISVTDNVSGVKTVEYYVDNNLLTRREKVDSSIELDVWNFEAGNHNVWLKAFDEQGNSAESEKVSFKIDRTIPSITSNKFIYEENEISDDDFIGKNELTVKIEASDDSGTIKSIHYGVSATEGVEPENWKVQAEHTIILNNSQNALQNGINFIYVKAEDIAGNCSVPLIKAIIKDTGKPGKALISSTTHKFANDVKDVELNTTASFVLKPTRTSGAGIKGYRYSLEEGVSETNTRVITSGTIESKSMEILDFEELADNKENEFYFLKVWCIGGNDLESDETVYSFRVDTTPPAGLYISLNPQVNYSNSYFYNDDVTNVSWNIPRDLTGIEKYELEITTDGEKLYSADTKNTSAVINVKNLCKAKNLKAGKLDVQVTAYDYAKNSVEASRSFNFDFEAPVFENEINIEEVEGNPVARKIIWGKVTDAQSECEQIVIEYTRLDEDNAKSNRVVLNAEDSELPESYTISTFRNDTAYFLSVTGYDKAGNTAALEKCFAVGNAVVPEVIRSEYRELSNGIIITGIKEKRPGSVKLINGKLILPENIKVYGIKSVNGNAVKERIDELNIANGTLIAQDNSIPAAEFEPAADILKYEIQCGQFVFENQNFIYEAENGIALTDVNVEVPVENKVKDTETVHFERIELGYPNALYINAVSNELDTPVTVKTDGFDIQNVNQIEIEGEAYRLNNSRSSIFFEPKNINIVTASQDKEIPLTNTYTDSSFNSVYGDIDGTNLELVLNDVTYIVKKAGISGNTINIYEA
ncbi:Ig-like domain (group 3), partial [Treponema bryantii]